MAIRTILFGCRPAEKEEGREGGRLEGHGRSCSVKTKKKNPDKSKKRESSPQLSLHQEVLSQGAQEVPQKEEEVQSSSRKCFFFFFLQLRLHEVWPLKGGRERGEKQRKGGMGETAQLCVSE